MMKEGIPVTPDQIVDQHDKALDTLSNIGRVAVPPDLISGGLSDKNAQWLFEQQENERLHKRQVAVARAERGLPTRAR
jgi:flagellar hook-associated protein FlgK